MAGRFAPSPTGDLHVGNLRTAMIAWLVGRGRGGGFLVRVEDLDRVTSSIDHERRQFADLGALGLEWDEPVWRQSERFSRYEAALASLADAGHLYECYCSRREVREAAAAPHGAGRRYPGTCRDLTEAERVARRAERQPALRLRAPTEPIGFTDLVAGPVASIADDVVVRRNDGVPAYNLAVVVDDAAQGIDHVVRGADLLTATPGHIALQRALDLPQPDYLHVALVVGPSGKRLAKRDGAITLADLARQGVDVDAVRTALLASIAPTSAGPMPFVSIEHLHAVAESFSASELSPGGVASIELANLQITASTLPRR